MSTLAAQHAQRIRPMTGMRILRACAVLSGLLLLIVVASLRFGAYPISTFEVLRTLLRWAIGRANEIPSEYYLVVVGLRLPRIALGIAVGSALSVSGAGFQALLRNPLADPYVLGVSSGAAVGAILALIFAPHSILATQAAAFLGAAVSIGAVYVLGRRGGQLDSTTLLLGGIVAASFLSGLIMFLMTTLPSRDLRGMAFWLMGDLTTAPSIPLGMLFALVALATLGIYSTSADLNLMLSGEQEALHLGANVPYVKVVVYVCASLLTGLAVSVSGAIGYVGLLVPHIMRLIFGSDHRLLIPAAALGGAITIVAADALARMVLAPNELPVGAMTALAGAPVFIYLLRRKPS